MPHIRITFVAHIDEEDFPKNDDDRLAFAHSAFSDPYSIVDTADEDETQLILCDEDGQEFLVTPQDVAEAESALEDEDSDE